MQSSKENILFEKIKGLDLTVLKNDRNIISPYELDIVLPEQKIAIEYNGDIIHSNAMSFLKRGKSAFDYHSIKERMALNNGYKLLFVWESDWNKQKDLIFSYIKDAINGKEINELLLNKESPQEPLPMKSVRIIINTMNISIPKKIIYSFNRRSIKPRLTPSENAISKVFPTSNTINISDTPIDVDLCLQVFDEATSRSIMNSLYKKKVIIKRDNNFYVRDDLMNKEKVVNKYTIPEQYK